VQFVQLAHLDGHSALKDGAAMTLPSDASAIAVPTQGFNVFGALTQSGETIFSGNQSGRASVLSPLRLAASCNQICSQRVSDWQFLCNWDIPTFSRHRTEAKIQMRGS